mgnify:CR=1 FL=1
MKKVITDYLDETANKYGRKNIFIENENNKISYRAFVNESKKIATKIIKDYEYFNQPIAVFIDKSIDTLKAMSGSLYSGNFYTILDTESPKNRIDLIIDTLKPKLILTNSKNIEKIRGCNYDIELLNIDLIEEKVDKKLIKQVNSKMISTNPAYILFTSGSTGVPKGTVISHKALITYAIWFKETFDINEKTVFGNQTPFYFSMSVSDIYSTVLSGATFCIIPKINFSFPVNLIKYLNNYKVNTIYWVPSALSIVANLDTFNYILPSTLEKVLFAGEVMPTPALNKWIKYLPNIMYANLFGPTETTDICTYYIVNRKFKDSESLPIGKPCNNCDILIINEEGKEAEIGEVGELYVRGDFLGNGYYNNSEKTDDAFVQNPVNKAYPEKVYRTGDLGKYNKYGEIEYFGRKDFQIKHMGYRIELGEIETNINAIKDLTICACIYDNDNKQIVLFYEAPKLTDDDIVKYVNNKLLNYMRPNKIIKLSKMPFNANGKIDRVKLKNDYKEMDK